MSAVRLVLTVALLVAVAGVATAAVDAGRHDRTATRLAAEVERVERAARLLADRDDPTAVGVSGARRVVTVDLPERGVASAGVASFALRGERDLVTYRVAGGRTRRHALPVDLWTPDGPVELRRAGHHDLSLGLVDSPARVRVRARTRAGERTGAGARVKEG